jgi:xylan 1,4-beta-xylosidase
MSSPDTVKITVHAGRRRGAYEPIWNWVGYDEPNYTYTRNGRKLLHDLARLSPAPVHVRAHNLLTSGDGTAALKWGSTNAYAEDSEGRPIYDWSIMDRIFDSYVEAGITPFVQIGFMPKPLSRNPEPYQHRFSPADATSTITTGWAAPPTDLSKWGGLVEAWARHLAERYGRETATSWLFEVWNEPDGHYWTGTLDEFCALYDVSVAALSRALPGVRVGGPHTCGAFASEKARAFLRGFLEHCTRGKNQVSGAIGSQLDFIAFHAKGNPVLYRDHVRMGLYKQLRDIEAGLKIVKEFPELAGRPVILGESDPEGCAACSARYRPQNGYRNGPLYGVYVVESIARTYELSLREGVKIEGAVTWAFQFEDQPYFDGFRDLATNGIGKAVLNALRMLGMLGGDWVEATSSHALPLQSLLEKGVRDAADVNAIATRDENSVSVLAWNYHDDDVAAEGASVELTVGGLPSGALGIALRHYRMDENNGNAFAVWKRMGSPQQIEGAAYRDLEAASQLALLEERPSVKPVNGGVSLRFDLPRQGVSLLRLSW